MSNSKYYLDHISLRVPGDELKKHEAEAPIKEDFKLYTMDLSYFSGKMEMYMRYKEITFQRTEPHALEFESILCENTGTEQLPQLYDCRKNTPSDKRWLRDTTPMIEYLEKDVSISKTSLPVIPECEIQAFFQRLFEDYADEYLWRPAMFWRWEPEFDRKIMGHRFYWEFARTTQFRFWLIPPMFRPLLLSLRQWLLSSWGEDCTTQAKKEVVKEQYYELLEILEKILQKQPYLFGNHPTLIDFGFAGPFFRHFSSDFTPRKVMQQKAPAVYEWMARLWNCTSSKMRSIPNGFPPPGSLPQCWDELFPLLPDYLTYYHLNAVAYKKGEAYFSWINKGQAFRVPVVHYRVWCRKKLQEHYTNCDFASQKSMKEIMMKHNIWELFWKDGVVDAPPECNMEPPFAIARAALPWRERTRLSYKWDADSIFASYFLQVGVKVVLSVSAVLLLSQLLEEPLNTRVTVDI